MQKMAQYNITVELLKSALLTMTAAQIRDALHSLPEGSRVNAAFIDDLPTGGGGGDPMTADDIIELLQDYIGVEQIPATLIDGITKLMVANAENALNYRATVNPYNTTWQNAYTCLPWDFVIASGVPSTYASVMEDGDWIIALQRIPYPTMSFAFTDSSKWLILKVSRLADVTTPVFRKHTTTVDGSGIEAIETGCNATGLGSFAFNGTTTSAGLYSTSHGYMSRATRHSERALACGAVESMGDLQYRETMLKLVTNTATPTKVVLPQPYYLESSTSSYSLKVWAVARVRNGSQAKSWHRNVLISRTNVGTTLSTLDSPAQQMINSPALNFTMSIPTNEAEVYFLCTGLAGQEVVWNIYIESLEVSTTEIPTPGG